MTAHQTTASIHLHGEIRPSAAIRYLGTDDNPQPYAVVDLDAKRLSSAIYFDSPEQLEALATVLELAAADYRTAIATAAITTAAAAQIEAEAALAIKKDAASREAAELALNEDCPDRASYAYDDTEGALEGVSPDTSNHFPSTEGV